MTTINKLELDDFLDQIKTYDILGKFRGNETKTNEARLSAFLSTLKNSDKSESWHFNELDLSFINIDATANTGEVDIYSIDSNRIGITVDEFIDLSDIILRKHKPIDSESYVEVSKL